MYARSPSSNTGGRGEGASSAITRSQAASVGHDRPSPHDDEPGQGAGVGPGGPESGGVLGVDDDRLDPGVGQDARPPDRWGARVDRHVSGPRAEDAVDRRDGLPPLGQEQPDAIPPADPPAVQAGRQPIGVAEEFAIRVGLASFVLNGHVVGPDEVRAVEELAEVVSVLAHGRAS